MIFVQNANNVINCFEFIIISFNWIGSFNGIVSHSHFSFIFLCFGCFVVASSNQTNHFDMVRIGFAMFCLENSIISTLVKICLILIWNEINYVLENSPILFSNDRKKLHFIEMRKTKLQNNQLEWWILNDERLDSSEFGYPNNIFSSLCFFFFFLCNWMCLHVLRMKLFLFICRNNNNNVEKGTTTISPFDLKTMVSHQQHIIAIIITTIRKIKRKTNKI